MRSAVSALRPFSSTISFLTSSQGDCNIIDNYNRAGVPKIRERNDRNIHLVQLIDGGADGAEHVGGYAGGVKYGVQQRPVVDFYDEFTKFQAVQDFNDDPQAFDFGQHRV
ncbi:unnamed protein product, partial [Nesidiocoris tenuis]